MDYNLLVDRYDALDEWASVGGFLFWLDEADVDLVWRRILTKWPRRAPQPAEGVFLLTSHTALVAALVTELGEYGEPDEAFAAARLLLWWPGWTRGSPPILDREKIREIANKAERISPLGSFSAERVQEDEEDLLFGVQLAIER
jgi:hypothetical protein